MITKQKRILLIVENDYFPRDARVYNEAFSLHTYGFEVFVLAPRNNKNREKFYEKVENKFFCFRHPHYEANTLKSLLFEYLIAFIFYLLFVPILVILKRIKIIHVANPPDFILPAFFWLKLFGVQFIFDVHDLSVETFNGKVNKKSFVSTFTLKILSFFENSSIKLADIVISTNKSIKEIIENKIPTKKVITVRNSNKILFKSVEEIAKIKNEDIVLGYFGVINDDKASGFENLAIIGKYLKLKGINYKFEIIGDGSGLDPLKKMIQKFVIEQHYIFRGFIELPGAFEIIKNFDFGILPWPNISKNNIHTAMKIMDYMCCGVPVCTLNLREQLVSTGGIGIHTNSFEEMVEEIINVYKDETRYENLRKDTLNFFNNHLCWEMQERELLKCYNMLP